MSESKFIRALRQIEKEASQAPSAKDGATPLSDQVCEQSHVIVRVV